MKRIFLLAAVLALTLGARPVWAGSIDADLLETAGRGDKDALHDVFQHSMQEQPGPGSHLYGNQLRELFSAVGNARFASALRAEPAPVQRRVMLFLNSAMSSS